MISPGNIYIAIVEDDESLCRSFGRLLRASGFQPIIYASGEAFLADLKHPAFDCLVLDVQLGGISGIELHRRLLAVGSKIPVIFITAHDEPETREEALTLGCAAYFHKNDSGGAVIEAIRRLAA